MRDNIREKFQPTWEDYALSGVAAALAVFSAGYGLGIPQVAFFFIAIITIGTLVSSSIHAAIPRHLATWDGLLYTMFGVLAAIFAQDLNDLLPGEGFPLTLRVAGWLCWMLASGSFVMWRDSTVLFQAVPGIALFGLVGTWDTFRSAPFLFFMFMLCFATLFARAHARGMMQRASDSGFRSFNNGTENGVDVWRSLRKGPWRWMAGPEWALGSALAVVAISLLGAPIFQWSLKGVAGFVKLPVPPSTAMRRIQSSLNGTNFGTYDGNTVGTGPHGDLRSIPIFKVKFPTPPYLRYRTFSAYTGHGWTLAPTSGFGVSANDILRLSRYSAKDYRLVRFNLEFLEGHYDSVPIPGDLDHFTGMPQRAVADRYDGTVGVNYTGEGNAAPTTKQFGPISGVVRVPTGSPSAAAGAPVGLPDVYTDATSVPERVSEFAKSVVAGKPGPAEKAEALRIAIAKRVTYDLEAPAVPAGQDPVEYFLFESKRGYCDLFASSMVMLARSVGLPARYVIGYAPFSHPVADADGYFTVDQTDYHAWAEVYFAGYGWVPYDATEGAAEAPGRGLGTSNVPNPLWDRRWFQILLGIVAGSVLLACLGSLALSWRKAASAAKVGRHRVELERSYRDLVRALEAKTAKPRRPSQTPFEYLETVRGPLAGAYDVARSATEGFVATFYGSADPSPAQVAEVRKSVDSAKSALKTLKRPEALRTG